MSRRCTPEDWDVKLINEDEALIVWATWEDGTKLTEEECRELEVEGWALEKAMEDVRGKRKININGGQDGT